MFYKRPLWCLILATALASCSQTGGGALPQAAGTSRLGGTVSDAAKHHRVAVHFRFKIPHRARGRGSRYLSPSTASLQITVFNAAHTSQLGQITANTTPGAGGCTAVASGAFTCSFAMNVPPGNDTFDVSAYNSPNAFGGKLSAIVDFAYSVAYGSLNNIAMTLGGIPATVEVALAGSGPFATGSAAAGFQLGGVGSGATQQFQLTAKDGSGNTIVNPGAPVLTLTSSAPSKLSVTAVPGSPGRFTLMPLAETNALPAPIPSTAITLTATATPVAGTGANPVTSTVSVQNDAIVYEASYDESATVQVYAPWSAAPVLTLPGAAASLYFGIAIDAGGNVYVCNYAAGTVTVFPPGSTTASRTITGLAHPCYPSSLGVDTAGDIFVPEYEGNVLEFTPTGGNTPTRTMINSFPAVALDASNNIYVANYSGVDEGISVFAPGSSTAPAFAFSAGTDGPFIPTFDASGNLYVLNYSGGNVTEYKPPFSSSSTVAKTFGSGSITSPYGVAVDGSGNVYVGNDNDSTAVTEYTQAAPATVARTLDSGYTGPIVVDPLGYVYVGSYSNAAVHVYPPGTSTAPVDTWTSGATDAWTLAVWP